MNRSTDPGQAQASGPRRVMDGEVMQPRVAEPEAHRGGRSGGHDHGGDDACHGAAGQAVAGPGGHRPSRPSRIRARTPPAGGNPQRPPQTPGGEENAKANGYAVAPGTRRAGDSWG